MQKDVKVFSEEENRLLANFITFIFITPVVTYTKGIKNDNSNKTNINKSLKDHEFQKTNGKDLSTCRA